MQVADEFTLFPDEENAVVSLSGIGEKFLNVEESGSRCYS
jgi:hypothetical protein